MTHIPKPSIYIPTLYLAEGLPYAIVMMMSGIFLKSLGTSNVLIGLTSFLYLPWALKFLWAPFIDCYGQKRIWIAVAQAFLAGLLICIAAIIPCSSAVELSIALLAVVALVSATQDVAIDGFYLDVLNSKQQALFVGIRNAAYRLSWLVGIGGLSYIAGSLQLIYGVRIGWQVAFAIAGLLLLVSAAFHLSYLPQVENKVDSHVFSSLAFLKIFLTYFQQPGIVATVIYILVFRFGDALLLKQAPNFLLDPQTRGGLALSVTDIALINGTVGVIFLLAGGIFGSWLISTHGLRKWLWPAAAVQNSAILLYWALAYYKPDLIWVYIANSLEQFAYGLGVSVYTVFLLTTVRSQYKAAHYAIATALMALGVMLPGAISGYLYEVAGYANFFLVCFLASLPGMITIFYLPLWRELDTSVTIRR